MSASAARLSSALCAVCLLFNPVWTAAQDRVRVGIDGAQQTTTTNLDAATTFTEFLEQGHITTRERVATAPIYGADVSVRVWKNLAVGAALSFYSKGTAGNVEAQIPHPFLFDRARLVSGATALKRTETGGHILFAWIIPADRLELTLSGGPSIFQVNQAVVSRVTYNQTYPYDVAQFTGVITERAKDRTIGFHAGAGVTWKLARHVGVGGTLRYSRGTLDTTVGDDSLSFDVGGLHAGGGLRLIF